VPAGAGIMTPFGPFLPPGRVRSRGFHRAAAIVYNHL